MARPAPLIRCALPIKQWPKIDRDLFTNAFTPANLFDEDGAGAQLRQVTKDKLLRAYGRWLRFLSMTEPQVLNQVPAKRVTRGRLRAWHRVLEDLASFSVWGYFDCLQEALRYMCPDHDVRVLRLATNRLRRVAHPLTSPDLKARDTRTLSRMAIAYMDQAEQEPEYRPLMGSSAFRDGLMAALISLAPLRRRAISELTISRHILRHEEGVTITVYGKNQKTGSTWSFPLSPALIPYFARYLDHHRPRLLQGNAHDALWITYEGKPLSLNGIGRRFDKATPKIFGERVMTHSFRHSAASTTAEHDSEAIGLIPALLGHTSPQSHERSYQKSNSIAATVKHRDKLRERRQRLAAELAASEDPGESS
jgi:integrase/recombinase XerD